MADDKADKLARTMRKGVGLDEQIERSERRLMSHRRHLEATMSAVSERTRERVDRTREGLASPKALVAALAAGFVLERMLHHAASRPSQPQVVVHRPGVGGLLGAIAMALLRNALASSGSGWVTSLMRGAFRAGREATGHAGRTREDREASRAARASERAARSANERAARAESERQAAAASGRASRAEAELRAAAPGSTFAAGRRGDGAARGNGATEPGSAASSAGSASTADTLRASSSAPGSSSTH